MASFFHKAKRKAFSRANRRAGRARALDDAGVRLLAQYDYDQISMAQIAREAGCSVGAFYGRYADKETYLRNLVASAFRTLTHYAQEDLGDTLGSKRSTEFIAGMIVVHVVSRMTAGKVAGVVRATMKLATVEPLAIEPFENYREAVAKRAIALLARTSNRSTPRQIHAAVQIVIATVTDAILQKKPGPLVVDSPRLNEALHAVLAGYLGLGSRLGWAGTDDGKDRPVAAVSRSEDPASLPEDHLAMFDPDMRVFRGTMLPGITRVEQRKAAIKKASPSKAQLKGSAGRDSKSAAIPPEPVTVKPPRVPSPPPSSKNAKKPTKPRGRVI